MAFIGFSYFPGHSVLHKLDPRIKFFLACLISLGIVLGPAVSLFFFLLLFLVLWIISRLTWKRLKQILIPFWIFFIPLTFLGLLFTPFSQINFIDVLIRFSRFTLLIAWGGLLSGISTPAQTGTSLRFILRPFGKKNAQELALAGSLALNFIPQILNQAKELKDAATLRGWNIKRSPWTLIRLWTLRLLQVLMEQSIWTAWAIELRSFQMPSPKEERQ